MKLLRAGDHKRMPWKNDGGETVEIAVSPDGAGLADFDWRVSMATVATDGPFSIFPGIDRTLSILEGNGMTLLIEGRDAVLLTRQTVPLAFAADVAVAATLADGPITDLNVMTRRGVCSHRVERVVVDGEREMADLAGTVMLLCRDGVVDVAGVRLEASDALLLNGGDHRALGVSGRATLYVIAIDSL